MKRLRAGVSGRGARDYDRVGTPISGRLGRRLVELAAVQAGDHVLDVATGRGAVLFAAPELAGEQWWRWLLTGDPQARAWFRDAAVERIRDVYERGAPELDEEALLAVAKKPPL